VSPIHWVPDISTNLLPARRSAANAAHPAVWDGSHGFGACQNGRVLAAVLIALAVLAILAARRGRTPVAASMLDGATAHRASTPLVNDRREFRLSLKIALLLVVAILLLGFVAVDFLRLVIRLRDIP
jgi:hypothetical protein